MSVSKNYYEVLGLPSNASPRRIKEQYRRLAKTYHPDKLTDPTRKSYFEERFKEINEAYAGLAEVVQRAKLSPGQRKLDFLYTRGKRMFVQNKYSKAMIIFNEILAIDSGYRDALTYMQESRRKHKRLAGLYSQANAFYRRNKWADAVPVFQAILKSDPGFRDAARKYKKARREQLMSDYLKQP
jgi:curved DNA-binding protein CbpA